MSRSMQLPDGVENQAGRVGELLDRLESNAIALGSAARQPGDNEAVALVKERQQLAASLMSFAEGALEPPDLRRLEELIVEGEKVRQALLIERETVRIEVQQKRAGRHVTDRFGPRGPHRSPRLNTRL